MLVLAIDPSTTMTGWAVLDENEVTQYGLIDCTKCASHRAKISYLYKELERIIKKYRPDIIAVEDQYFHNNVKTLKTISRAVGAIMVLAGSFDIPMYTYQASAARKLICGTGKATKRMAADKLREIVPLPDKIDLNITDAILIGLTCLANRGAEQCL